MSDAIQPDHYKAHPSGVECIDIIEHMNFNLGNAIKYVWRAGLKGDNPVEQDLKKAVFYIEREIDRLRGVSPKADEDLKEIEALCEKLKELQGERRLIKLHNEIHKLPAIDDRIWRVESQLKQKMAESK